MKTMKTTTIEQKYRAAVKALGKSFASIERELLRRKIVGVPQCEKGCVLAEYFTQCMGVTVRVDWGSVLTGADSFTLPLILRRFIVSFDGRKRHPKLYPQPAEWTPPIDGWQYRMQRDGDDLKVAASCPVRLFFETRSGCGWGWCPNGWCFKHYATPEQALRAAGVRL